MFTDDKVIPEGSIVTFNSRKMRLNKNIYVDPETFDPDRYLPENASKIPKAAMSFFGFGLRVCPGMFSHQCNSDSFECSCFQIVILFTGVQYTYYCGKVIVSRIVRSYKLRSTMKLDEIKYKATLMLEMVGGYHVSLEKRK